jgi:hypothetical protein
MAARALIAGTNASTVEPRSSSISFSTSLPDSSNCPSAFGQSRSSAPRSPPETCASRPATRRPRTCWSRRRLPPPACCAAGSRSTAARASRAVDGSSLSSQIHNQGCRSAVAPSARTHLAKTGNGQLLDRGLLDRSNEFLLLLEHQLRRVHELLYELRLVCCPPRERADGAGDVADSGEVDPRVWGQARRAC